MNSGKSDKIKIQVRPIPPSYIQSYPSVTEPVVIGSFSVTKDRFYENSLDTLRFFKPPEQCNFPLDLNKGLQDAIKKPDTTWFECMDHMCCFISDNQEQLCTPHFGEPHLNADIATSRYVLELLMCTPYEYQKDWRLHLTRYNNTSYICHQETIQDEIERREPSNFTAKIHKSWDYKLQQYCMSKSARQNTFVDEPVDECSEFNAVYKITMDGIRIMYSAEMTGAEPSLADPLDVTKLKFVELKTRLGNMNRQQWNDFKRNKALRWWCQCFLVNIETIHIGLVNESGQVYSIDPNAVRNLRKESETDWIASACTYFLIRFLRVVEELVANINDPTTVIELNYNADAAEITYTIIEGRSQYTFIPDWYRSIMALH